MSHPIKVAMLIQGYLPRIGGAERQLAALAPLLKKRNVEIHVLTRRYAGLSAYEEIDGVPVHRLPIPAPKAVASLSYTASALLLLRRLKPDVLHAHELLSPTTTAVLAKRLMGTPVVAKILRGGLLGDLSKLKNRRGGMKRLDAFRTHVDGFIAISEEIRTELTAVNIPQAQQLFIPNGVDTKRFSPATAAEKQALRQALNLPQGPIAIFTGRLSPEKRIHDLLSVWSAVREQQPNANLLIIGSGDEESTLKAAAGAGVHFLGRKEDVAPYLRAANLFILPSETEGLSNALLEAMACGLPCVATTVGGATDLITHQQSGWLIAPKNINALQAGIITLLANKNLQDDMSIQARNRIMADYPLTQTADRLRQLYDTVIQNRSIQLASPSLGLES